MFCCCYLYTYTTIKVFLCDAIKQSSMSSLQSLLFQLAGDWKNLRRAFKKLDKTGNGFLTLPEFRNVLKLANVVLDEDEVYNVMHTFDEDLSGRLVEIRAVDNESSLNNTHISVLALLAVGVVRLWRRQLQQQAKLVQGIYTSQGIIIYNSLTRKVQLLACWEQKSFSH